MSRIFARKGAAVVGAAAGVYYWTLRRHYADLMEGAQLFQDLRAREQQALELNDTVLQGLVVARMSLEVGDEERALASIDATITSDSAIITDLLGQPARGSAGLLRSTAAVVDGADDERDDQGPA